VPPRYDDAPNFVQRVTARLLAGEGDLLPVSAIPVDGAWPTGTTKYEKRNIALEIPVWDASICIQCNKCVLVCPHAAIRAKFYEPAVTADAPDTFKEVPFRSSEFPGRQYTLQVATDDCTGCSLCAQVCPAKDKTNPRHKALDMVTQGPTIEADRANWNYFLQIPDPDRIPLRLDVKGTQFMRPLIEFSGACAGCGETPYLKLLTQMFGDRVLMANATGCSSIYGGNLPTTPYCQDSHGRGPAWANSLFEDNAEFGLGMRLALDRHHQVASTLVKQLMPKLGEKLGHGLLFAPQSNEAEIADQRARVEELRRRLEGVREPAATQLLSLADHLVRKSVWIIGGDGWAYDIGFGGLDHVLGSGANVKVLVLDTEVYSNTGGQASKATPLGAVAKFAAGGKPTAKKDLALMAVNYGHVYVARVAFGAKDSQTVMALREAEAYPGPALIIAYSHCIAHGYPMHLGLEQQKMAVDSGHFPLFRYDPRVAGTGQPAFKLDSAAPKVDLSRFMASETRFGLLRHIDPDRADALAADAQKEVKVRYARYERYAADAGAPTQGNGHPPAPPAAEKPPAPAAVDKPSAVAKVVTLPVVPPASTPGSS
jgi:pyruvate-ferredoxin/flavodoxin oxidoreductase